MSLTFALWGCGLLALRHGDLARAVTLLERLCASVRRWAGLPPSPLMAAGLGATV